jgi:hypothetical protein
VKLFPAAGWFAVYALPRHPYRLILPLTFWALDEDTLRSIVPGEPNASQGAEAPGPALIWGDAVPGAVLLGYYHQDFTPKSQIQSLVEEALVQGAKLATNRGEEEP